MKHAGLLVLALSLAGPAHADFLELERRANTPTPREEILLTLGVANAVQASCSGWTVNIAAIKRLEITDEERAIFKDRGQILAQSLTKQPDLCQTLYNKIGPLGVSTRGLLRATRPTPYRALDEDQFRAVHYFVTVSMAAEVCPGLKAEYAKVGEFMYGHQLWQTDTEPNGWNSAFVQKAKHEAQSVFERFGRTKACAAVVEMFGPNGDKLPGLLTRGP